MNEGKPEFTISVGVDPDYTLNEIQIRCKITGNVVIIEKADFDAFEKEIALLKLKNDAIKRINKSAGAPF